MGNALMVPPPPPPANMVVGGLRDAGFPTMAVAVEKSTSLFGIIVVTYIVVAKMKCFMV